MGDERSGASALDTAPAVSSLAASELEVDARSSDLPDAAHGPSPRYERGLELETVIDLEREAGFVTSSSGRASAIPPPTRRSIGPAAPMAVPAIRPPSAAPPPLRATPPPPASSALADSSSPVRPSIPPLPPPPWAEPSEPSHPEPAPGALPASGETTSERVPSEPQPELAQPTRPLRWLWLALPILVGLLAWLVIRLQPLPAGALVIGVSDPSGATISSLRVYVDEQLRCSRSPCRIDGLSVGGHSVRAEAPDHAPSEAARIELEEASDATLNLKLTPIVKPARLSVAARGTDLVVSIDGNAHGPPPVELLELQPGPHLVSVSGPRFETLQETVQLAAGEYVSLGPLKPKVKLGRLEIRQGTGAAGAQITLDGKPVPNLPAVLELPGQRPYRLVAEKPGYDRFETVISFPDGKAELTLDVALLESDVDAQPGAALNATLNINSIPVSQVLLDGRAIGHTPLLRVKTSAGSHELVFVHPQRGKRRTQVEVAPGRSKTVSMRF
jgi:serine/threonine-protein kinase